MTAPASTATALARRVAAGLASAWLAGCAAPPGDDSRAALPFAAISNVIVGGGMRHCTSTRGADATGVGQCTAPWPDILRQDPAFAGVRIDQVQLVAPAPTVFSYSVTPERIAAFEALPARLVSATTVARLRPILLERSGAPPISAPDFARLVDAQLSPAAGAAEQAAVRHAFVDWPAAPPARQLQARSVMFMEDAASAQIYRAFVGAAAALAGGRKPKVALVTAAADNPFNDRDIYVTALQSAGAEVTWLPLDGGLRRALDAGDCTHLAIDYSAYAQLGSARRHDHMELLFPDLAAAQHGACENGGARLNAALAGVHGIFFSGGNQARIVDSLASGAAEGRPGSASAQWRILKERFDAGKLVVAGSSAGDAVQAGGLWRGQPVPMIAGGTSLRALAHGFGAAGLPTPEERDQAATSYPAGGLGFFRFGPLDSHFSNRAREGRLLRLVSDSGMDYGFGVDENTALVVGQAQEDGSTPMAVIGQAGVWVVDVRTARAAAAANAPFHIDDAVVHYLHAGDRLSISRDGALSVSLSQARALLPVDAAAAPVQRPDWSVPGSLHFVELTRAMGLRGARAGGGISGQAPGALFTLALQRGDGSQFRAGAAGEISYANLRISIHPCAQQCIAQ